MSRMVRAVTVVGARPQFVKAAALTDAIRRASGIEQTLVHTGQHYDAGLSQVFFNDLGLDPPARNLEVGSLPHGAQTGRILERTEEVLAVERPDVVIVFGDTNSTLAAALAGAKLAIPVAHIEAGLRSFRRNQPEEINRVLTDHVSSRLYCPSETAVRHLSDEGIVEGVVLSGDVMFDVLRTRMRRIPRPQDVATALGVSPGEYAFATIHRPENTDDPERLEAIVAGLEDLHRQGTPVVAPLHPRTTHLLEGRALGFHAVPPVSYDDCLALAGQAALVLTDSGGLQKEAMWLRTPCVTIREETEWPETVAAGWNRLSRADRQDIVDAAASARVPEVEPPAPYGDGHATDVVVADLLAAFGGG
jgi:UDP-N-acetylglucosamine 2-epimerase